MEKLHNENAEVLDKIIDEIGYPTIAKVGTEANSAAWLIIQHAISKPAFMKKCCNLLQKYSAANGVNPTQLAFLTDRIATFEGEPQLFGTQFDWDKSGELSPNLIDGINRVNQRRKSIGLNSLEEQTVIIRQRAKYENQSPP